MVDLTVKIEGGGVYVAGDSLYSSLSFHNKSSEPQTIAWVGAQIHCQCVVREAVVKLKEKEQVSSPVSDTAFFPNRGERGKSILSTRSTVLLCNVTLKPAETKTISYIESIPVGGPPSFRGHIVGYTYKVTIGVQKPNCPAQITRLPVKVILIPAHLQRPLLTSPKSSNPFLQSEESHSTTELGLEAIAVESGRRNSSSYTLTASGESLGRVIVPRTAFRLGDEVTAIFDCSNCTHPVLQVKASLVYLETIQESSVQPSVVLKPVTTVVAQKTHSCTNGLITHYSLPVPPSLTQTFNNETVTVTWQIQFHLLISRGSWGDTHAVQQSIGPGGCVSEVWLGPLQQQVDTIDWCLPITVLPSLYSELPPPQQTLSL